ncbi:hypothetical protein [uncultured Bacteroides sp.]|uniref:hypothetical protein n=1 Tax=uncultured Bacteroides sp. TaxID=162156 RepID=UPI00263241B4|nr:hypothetical protein [uncultured Bacteroides sp.]
MDLDELQNAWKKLNEQVKKNALVHDQEIQAILNTRRLSYFDRLVRMDNIVIVVLFFICILLTCRWAMADWPLRGHMILALCMSVLLAGLFGMLVDLHHLLRIKSEHDLDRQIENVLLYRRFYIRRELWGYVHVVLVLIGFFLLSGNVLVSLIIVGLICVAAVVDYYQFSIVRDILKDLVRTNQELKQVKENSGFEK